VDVFVRSGGGWAGGTEAAQLTASDGTPGTALGGPVAISSDGSTIVAGAPGDSNYLGAVYVFQRPPTGWATGTETAKLTASDGANGDTLGDSVAVSDDGSTVVAGAPYATMGNGTHQGAVYVFRKTGGSGPPRLRQRS